MSVLDDFRLTNELLDRIVGGQQNQSELDSIAIQPREARRLLLQDEMTMDGCGCGCGRNGGGAGN